MSIVLCCSPSSERDICLQKKSNDCPKGYYWNGITCTLINYGLTNQKCNLGSSCYKVFIMNNNSIPQNNIHGLPYMKSQVQSTGASKLELPQSYIPTINNGVTNLPQTYVPTKINIRNNKLPLSYIS